MALSEEQFHFLARANTCQWLMAATRQCERCLAAQESRKRLFSNQPSDSTALTNASDLMRKEEHFLLIALGKSEDWLKKLCEFEPDLQIQLEEFNARLPHCRDLRNMREHEEDYFSDDGIVQKRFVYSERDARGEVILESDATGTIITDGRYLIGGRLDVLVAVETTATICRTIFPNVDSLCNGLEAISGIK